jgi:hypothetical protein
MQARDMRSCRRHSQIGCRFAVKFIATTSRLLFRQHERMSNSSKYITAKEYSIPSPPSIAHTKLPSATYDSLSPPPTSSKRTRTHTRPHHSINIKTVGHFHQTVIKKFLDGLYLLSVNCNSSVASNVHRPRENTLLSSSSNSVHINWAAIEKASWVRIPRSPTKLRHGNTNNDNDQEDD